MRDYILQKNTVLIVTKIVRTQPVSIKKIKQPLELPMESPHKWTIMWTSSLGVLYTALNYYYDMTLSQDVEPMGVQLSL